MSVISVDVTGQTVVEMAMVSVTTIVESAGQSGTSGAQEVTVCVAVVKMVEVVKLSTSVGSGSGSGSGFLVRVTDAVVSVVSGKSDEASLVEGVGLISVIGQIVVEMAIVSVTMTVESAGQSVISGAQEVKVRVVVVKMVDVVRLSSGTVVGPADVLGTSGVVRVVSTEETEESGDSEVLSGGACVSIVVTLVGSTSVIGQTVVEIAIVSVTISTGPSVQPGFSGPQLVMVKIDVVKIVDVVKEGTSVGSTEVSRLVLVSEMSSVVGAVVRSVGVGSGVGAKVVSGLVSVARVVSGVVETSGCSAVVSSGRVESVVSGSVMVTGQMVVEMAMVSVTRTGPPGHGTSGAHDMMVLTEVVKIVEVVRETVSSDSSVLPVTLSVVWLP
jgi:hypothetical protein